MLKHRRKVGLQVVELGGYRVEAAFHRVHAPDEVTFRRDGLLRRGRLPSTQYGVEMVWMPTERGGQSFQCARTPLAIDGIALNFTNNRRRNLRPFYEFALIPAQLSQAVVNGPRDRIPVVRHATETSGLTAASGRISEQASALRPQFR